MKRDAAAIARAAPAGAAVLLALAPALADAQSGPVDPMLPAIDRARVLVPDGELGGHAVQVSEIGSRRAPQDVLTEVERHWRMQGADPVLRAQSGTWSVLSRRIDSAHAEGSANEEVHDSGFETLQLRSAPGGGSEGLLTRWTRTGAVGGESATPLSRLLPDDARSVRQLASRDAGAHSAETVIARFEHSLDESERRIEGHLRRAGFVAVRAPQRPLSSTWRDDRARFFQSVSAQLLVTLHRQPQGTSVVLYHVRSAP